MISKPVRIFVIVLSVLMNGCDNKHASSNLVGRISESVLTVVTAVQTPTTAAEYILFARNSTGKELHNVSIELYLLDMLTNEYVILANELPNIAKDETVDTTWTLSRNNPVGKRWEVTQGGLFQSASEIDTNHPPIPRIFIKSREGSYEVLATTYNLLIMTSEKTGQKMRNELNPETVKSFYENAKVPIPKEN